MAEEIPIAIAAMRVIRELVARHAAALCGRAGSRAEEIDLPDVGRGSIVVSFDDAE